MTPTRRRRVASIGVFAVALLAGAEWVAAARAYRPSIAAEDWEAARERVRARPLPVLVGTEWLGPSIRAEIPEAGALRFVARADDRGLPEHWRVWAGSDDAAVTDAGGGPVVDRHALGGLMLTRHAETRESVVADLAHVENGALTIAGPRGRCPTSARGFDCRPGRVAVEVVEIDYRPRRCFGVRGFDGRAMTLTAAMPLGDRLVGHVGIGDFNARLRSDSPVRVEVRADGHTLMRTVVTDDQGWWGFELPTRATASATVEVSIASAWGGSFESDGSRSNRHDPTVCFELRALARRGEHVEDAG